MFKASLLLFIICCCSFGLSAQNNLPKCYADYELIENVDSLERYVYAHQENQLAYMHGLISLELSREAYKDKYGQDISTIKKIAAEQNNELAKIIGLILEVSTDLWTEDKTRALANLHSADKYFTKSKDTLGMLSICNTALVLLDTDNYEQPYVGGEKNFKLWYQKALDWGKTTNQAKAKLMYYEIYLYDYFIRINTDQKDFKEGFDMVNQALAIIKKMPNQNYYKFHIYYALSIALEFQDKSKAYLEYAFLAYQYGENLGYNERATAICNLADAYLMDEKYKEAEKYYNLFYELYKKQKTNELHDEIYLLSHISEVQYLQGKYKTAYNNKLREDSLKIILNEKTKVGNILELETKYEVGKKEAQNEFLMQEKKSLELRNFILITGMISLLMVLSLLYNTYNKLKQTNKALSQAKQEIEKYGRFRERLFSMVAHDLRSPVVTYTGITDMISYLIKNNRLEELKKVSLQLDTTSVSLTNLIDNLLLWAKGQKQVATTLQSSIDTKEVIQSILPIYAEIANWHNIHLDVSLQDNLKILATKDSLSLIVRNLLDNAIKNTNQGETIKVQTVIEQDFVNIIFINKSNAINPQIIQKIQQLFSGTATDENSENDGLGLGIILINEFVRANNGTISLTQNEDTLIFELKFIKHQ